MTTSDQIMTWARPASDVAQPARPPAPSGPAPRPDEKRGTVYISRNACPSGDTEEPSWGGYWEQEPDGPPAMVERGPGWDSLKDALMWAQERSDRVVVLLDSYSGSWWAGIGPTPGGFEGKIELS